MKKTKNGSKPAVKKTNTDATLVTFLLDRTSSMADNMEKKQATIRGFNHFKSTLATEGRNIEFSLLQFSSHGIEKTHLCESVAKVPDLTDASYRCGGMTPLIEACIRTIRALDEALKKREDKPKVVVCFQTDGEENASGPGYTMEVLNTLRAEKEKEGWQFNFMGVGIDAYEQASQMGIATANTMSYDINNPARSFAAFWASASNAAGFSSGKLRSTAYSASQKLAAGDPWAKSTPPQTKMTPVARPHISPQAGAQHYLQTLKDALDLTKEVKRSNLDLDL